MAFLAKNPDSGAVILGSVDCRQVRWSMDGRGESDAAKVIYTAQLPNGELVALLIYGQGATETSCAHPAQHPKRAESCS